MREQRTTSTALTPKRANVTQFDTGRTDARRHDDQRHIVRNNAENGVSKMGCKTADVQTISATGPPPPNGAPAPSAHAGRIKT